MCACHLSEHERVLLRTRCPQAVFYCLKNVTVLMQNHVLLRSSDQSTDTKSVIIKGGRLSDSTHWDAPKQTQTYLWWL